MFDAISRVKLVGEWQEIATLAVSSQVMLSRAFSQCDTPESTPPTVPLYRPKTSSLAFIYYSFPSLWSAVHGAAKLRRGIVPTAKHWPDIKLPSTFLTSENCLR